LLRGFGIPYFPGDMPVDIAAVGAALGQAFDALPPSLSAPISALSLGAIFCAGAYCASASHVNFLGQVPAQEILV
jgi:diaminopimelate decarboxylase